MLTMCAHVLCINTTRYMCMRPTQQSGSRGRCVKYESLSYCTKMTLSAGYLYISNK